MLTEHTSRISDFCKHCHALLNLTKPSRKGRRCRLHGKRKIASTAQQHCKRDVPRPVPSYNPHAQVNIPHAIQIRDEILDMMGHHCAFLAPLTSDDSLLILDSGCSIAITPNINDFIDGTYKPQDCTVSGIGSGLSAEGIGTIQWSLTDTNGQITTLELQCLCVPQAPCRLLPPQQLSAHKSNPTSLSGAWIGEGLSAKVVHNGAVIVFSLPSNLQSALCTPNSWQ